jgi:hypothetical protein
MKHVVMFSSGVGSWAAARRIADQAGTENLHLVFSDVGGTIPSEHDGEDVDNYRFLGEAAYDILGDSYYENLHVLREGRTVWDVFNDTKFIGNTRISNCSRILKQEPARKWLDENCDPSDTIVYVGIDWSEQHRLEAMTRNYEPWTLQAPLCNPPYLDKDDVLAMLRERGIEPPRLYGMGMAHANCGGFCVRQGQGGFLNLLEKMPDRYAYHEAREQAFREEHGKDVAILRDRRGGTTKPLTLKTLRERAQAGGEVDRDDIGGCGCFVE